MRKLNYSYNPAITSQMTKEEAAKKTTGWQLTEAEWKEETMMEMVKNRDYIPSKLKDGEKLKKNVQEVYFLALDFDKGETTFEEYRENKVKLFQFSAFMHTTVNHQKELIKIIDEEEVIIPARDKFRVIVPFSRPVRLSEMEEMKKSGIIQKKFSLHKGDIDISCMDANRYFKQNPEAITYFHDHEDFLDPDLLSQKDATNKTQTKATGSKKSQNNKNNKTQTKAQGGKKSQPKFSLTDYLKKADGTEIQVRDVKQKEQIFCPNCDLKNRSNPESANAFIDINKAGCLYIYCSSEQTTFWQDTPKIDELKSSLFWNTTVAAPSVVGCESVEDDKSALYVFKNEADFQNFCYQNNINPGIRNYLPRREIIFNPGLPSGLQDKYYNLFEETEFMKKDYSAYPRFALKDLSQEMRQRTPVIYEILHNIFGKDEYLERFINWTAYILQERKKAYTAWLITSEETGVGKDLVFVRILQPLFGKKQSQLLNGKRIAKDFNRQDLNCFLRGYNEVFSSNDVKGNLSRKEWLKDAITNEKQTIEFKGVDSFEANNFMNFILYSNNENPILLDKNDRRFNVIRNASAKKIRGLSFYTEEKDIEPAIERELPEFSQMVFTLDYSRERANETIDSEAKQNLIEISADPFDEFRDALISRNAEYFLLKEVFKTKDEDKFCNIDNSKVPEEIKEHIEQKGAIPSQHMNKIVSFHFRNYTYKEALKKLQAKGLKAYSYRFEKEIVKGYMHKGNVNSLVAGVTPVTSNVTDMQPDFFGK